MSISFDVGEELQAIVDAVHEFAADRIRPELREFERARGLPEDLRRECHELGVTTLVLPEAMGGLDLLDTRAAALCWEAGYAWGDLGAAAALPGARMAGALVVALGDEETQRRLLTPFANEETGWQREGTLAFVEGPFGIAPDAIETTATRDGDSWVLNGTKRYVQSAGVADLTVVLARIEGANAPDPWDRMGLFAFAGIPRGLEAEKRNQTLGLSAAHYATLQLNGVRTSAENRLDRGEPGQLRQALRHAIARKKVLDAARLVGCVRAASEYAFQYATERKAFGVHLYEHQALAFMMADMATLVDGMRTLVWQAAWELDRGADAYPAAMRAFRQASLQAVEVASDAVQVLGGHGYLYDHPVEKWMRDVRTLSLVDGLTDEAAELAASLAQELSMAIDFELSPRLKQTQDMARTFAETFVRPYALETDALKGPHPKFIAACKQFGLGTGQVGGLTGGSKEPSSSGKGSERNRMMLIAAEELSWGDASAALNMPGAGLGGPPVRITGTPEQQERFMSVFAPDTFKFGAYALTEPGAGSDAKAIRTSCRKDGDEWVLNGSKIYITNGKKAEWTVVFATIDPALGRAGQRAFVVEKGTPGFSVPKVEEKMGLRGSETAEQVFEDCRVPAFNLLGGEQHYEQRGKSGFKTAMKTFDATRPLVAVMAVGIARAAYEIARDWVKQHYALSQHTHRYHRLAETLAWMDREIRQSRLLAWKAAWMLDHDLPNAKESSMSKAYAGKMVDRVTASAIEILGPEGVLQNRLVEKLYRDQKVYDIFEGTGQIQRLVISRRLFANAKP